MSLLLLCNQHGRMAGISEVFHLARQLIQLDSIAQLSDPSIDCREELSVQTLLTRLTELMEISSERKFPDQILLPTPLTLTECGRITPTGAQETWR